MVRTNTNTIYNSKETTPAKANWVLLNVGSEVEEVNLGRTSTKVLKTAKTDSIGVVPSTRKVSTLCRQAPKSKHRPTTPLQTIITVANTVSRAKALVAVPPESIKVTIKDTSIMVTAKAKINVPNGSPTRRAMTSAWCTATNTALNNPTHTKNPAKSDKLPPLNANKTTSANNGIKIPHAGVSNTGLRKKSTIILDIVSLD